MIEVIYDKCKEYIHIANYNIYHNFKLKNLFSHSSNNNKYTYWHNNAYSVVYFKVELKDIFELQWVFLWSCWFVLPYRFFYYSRLISLKTIWMNASLYIRYILYVYVTLGWAIKNNNKAIESVKWRIKTIKK